MKIRFGESLGTVLPSCWVTGNVVLLMPFPGKREYLVVAPKPLPEDSCWPEGDAPHEIQHIAQPIYSPALEICEPPPCDTQCEPLLGDTQCEPPLGDTQCEPPLGDTREVSQSRPRWV